MRILRLAFVLAIALGLLSAIGVSAQGPVTITVTQVDQSRFPQIEVYVSVTDPAGNPVRNLAPDAFRIEQNGKPVAALAATRAGEQGPVSTVLVIDHSGSMAFGNKMSGAKQAATTFVNLMRPGDKTALVQFDTEIDTLAPLTDDKNALLAGIQKIVPRGNTELYDALAQAGKYLEAATGRKAIIVVTDGMDNASKINRDTLMQQVSAGGYSIYTIGLGNRAAGYGNQEGIDETTLRDIANATMGTYSYAPDASQLAALYQQLSLLIQNEYKLTYTSPDPFHDGLKREIVVTAPGAGATRATYNPGGVIPEAATDWSSWVLFLVALALLVALFFAPMGWRMLAERQALVPAPAPAPAPAPIPAPPPAPAQSRVKLTGGGPRLKSPPVPTARPARIKLGKKTASANPERQQMPWDENK